MIEVDLDVILPAILLTVATAAVLSLSLRKGSGGRSRLHRTEYYQERVLECGPIQTRLGRSRKTIGRGGMVLQVLGSGGPNDVASSRASTSYLVWLDKKAVFMFDAGSGASLRYGQMGPESAQSWGGADFADLRAIFLTHLHVDHSIDVGAMMKRGYFYKPHPRPVRVLGPDGNDFYPSTSEFLSRFFKKGSGLYGYVEVEKGYPVFEATDIPATEEGPVRVWPLGGASSVGVSALSVGHANVPSVAYRVDGPGGSVAFGGDQNDENEERFIRFVRGVDVLVMHFPESEEGGCSFYHGLPSFVGRVARASGVGLLILSHFMACSKKEIEENLRVVRREFSGRLALACDLDAFRI